MLRKRIIPCLQLLEDNLVKTVNFRKPNYIGDFANTARIFNELEVDELCLLGIRTTIKDVAPNFDILQQVANECFMPLSYGGGISDFETAKKILHLGFEKVIINSAIFNNPELITKLSEHFGSQSIVVSIDYKRSFWGKEHVYSHSGKQKQKGTVTEWIEKAGHLGAGEILLTSIDHEGTWLGYDLQKAEAWAAHTNLPIIIHGGAGSTNDINEALRAPNISAVALGSMVVYQQKGMGVLVNFPDHKKIKRQ